MFYAIEIRRVHRFASRNERNEFVRERLLTRMSVCPKCAYAVLERRRKNEFGPVYAVGRGGNGGGRG